MRRRAKEADHGCFSEINIEFYMFLKILKHGVKRRLRRLREYIVCALVVYRFRLEIGNEEVVFIDCGANLGQAFDWFSKFFPVSHVKYQLFEANKNCEDALREKVSDDPNVEINIKAISTFTGELKLFGLNEENQVSQGASVEQDHNFGHDGSSGSALVPCIDFLEVLKQQSNNATLFVKMDIEGHECDVLERVIEQGCVDKISVIFLEFHSQYLEPQKRSLQREREKNIKNKLRDEGIQVFSWH
jgi:FkbM family methyltransferase